MKPICSGISVWGLTDFLSFSLLWLKVCTTYYLFFLHPKPGYLASVDQIPSTLPRTFWRECCFLRDLRELIIFGTLCTVNPPRTWKKRNVVVLWIMIPGEERRIATNYFLVGVIEVLLPPLYHEINKLNFKHRLLFGGFSFLKQLTLDLEKQFSYFASSVIKSIVPLFKGAT